MDQTTQAVHKTTLKARMIRDILTNNGGRMFTVTFKKQNGEMRTLTGNYGNVAAQAGHNNAAHYEKYVTVILPTKDAKGNPERRNVNCETVVCIKTNGTVVNFE